MGDNSMKDVGISGVVTQTEVSKTSIGDVVAGANEESVNSIVFFSIFMELLSGDVTDTKDFLFSFSVPIFTEAVFMFDLTPDVCKLLPVEIDVPVPIVSETSVVTGSTSETIGDASHVATVPIVSETSVVTGSTSERVGDVSHVATVPIDTSSGRDIVDTSPILSEVLLVTTDVSETIGTVATCDTSPTDSDVLPVTTDVSETIGTVGTRATFFARPDATTAGTIINTGTETTGGSSVVDAGTMINTGTETTVTKAFTPSISTHTNSETSNDGAIPRCLGFGINYRTSIYDGTTTRCLDSGINYCTSISGGTTSRCIGTNI
jgi:hypothetical protein